VAERDIKASRDFLIEDAELTEKNRDKAVKEVLAVYDFDRASSNLVSRVKGAFDLGRDYFDGAFDPESAEPMPPPPESTPSREARDDEDAIIYRFYEILEISPDEKIFEALLKFDFPAQAEESVVRLITEVSEKGVVGNRQMLKKEMEKGGITLHEIHSKTETRVTDFNRFYDLEGARRLLANRSRDLGKAVPYPGLADVSIKLAQSLVKPNLTFNQRETELRKDLARKSIKPKYFKIKTGEMLVREGERIGSEHLLKLSGENRLQNRVNAVGPVPAMTVLIGTLFVVVYLIGLKVTRVFDGNPREFFFIAVTLMGTFVFVWAYNFIAEEVARGFPYFTSKALLFAMPVAFGAMLISIFQGIGTAAAFALVISVLASLATGGTVEFFIYFFISSMVAAHGVRDCSERGILIKAGFFVGLINIVLSLSIGMIHGSLYTLESLIAAASGFTGGILAGVIATGILPLIEMSFGFTTDIKLLELANLDQPLLRELMVRAPGTYHHSMITSNMVEATAKAVEANPLLARVSAYYHDIGKMKKPLYFIENQLGSENRHEKLAPSMSSLILISHVKDGVELAKEHKLSKELIDIIQQHHGTSLISFFYQKAKDRMGMKGNKFTEIKEEDFRYPGPKPQTKEAGLVMLADMVEAACRSLGDPTPARIQGMVQKIINKVFSDGQLNECELTLKDLNEIARSFNKTLSGIFHHRVEYPEMVAKTTKKGKNGNSDQVSKEDSGSRKPEDKAEVDKGLKRLGLS
jgi:putative nucleotidyltransferase with HDIG domain